jgi:probable HAF family extracellular repeat protein
VGASAVNSALDLAGRHAFLYQNGKLSDLHPAVSFGGVWSEALGINDQGDIVGASETAAGDCYHSFLFRASDHTVIDLHSIVQAGRCSSRANAVNGKGEIVGSRMSGRGAFRAFLYSNGEAADLNRLIPPNSGWVLQTATGINDQGQIVGFGQYRALTEIESTRGTLSAAELTRLTTLCGFIQGNGSGFGVCKSCRFGGLTGVSQ